MSATTAVDPKNTFRDHSDNILFYVLEPACTFATDNSRAIVVIESANDNGAQAIEELSTADARNLALGYASRRGVSDPRLSGVTPYPYPVNSEGLTLDRVVDQAGQPLPPQSPRMQPARYRVDIPVTKALL